MIGAVVLVLFVTHEVLQPREREISTSAAVAVIETYRKHLSPRLEGRVTCRFEPTCSLYGLESVKKRGALAGSSRALWRILRCGPWTPAGTTDLP
jgi:putative membrane protein insertion efficiency factor